MSAPTVLSKEHMNAQKGNNSYAETELPTNRLTPGPTFFPRLRQWRDHARASLAEKPCEFENQPCECNKMRHKLALLHSS